MEIPTGSKSFARLNPGLFQTRLADGGWRNTEIIRERDLHDQIEAYARARGWMVCHSRMDRASTVAVGFPDFALFMDGGLAVFLECKRPGGKATPAQLAKLAQARKLGFAAEIVTSMGEALAAIALAGRAAQMNKESRKA
jgi:hypothetical protein